MKTAVRQAVGAIYLGRADNGNVKISVTSLRDVARLELRQDELHQLYCEIGMLLVDRGVSDSG